MLMTKFCSLQYCDKEYKEVSESEPGQICTGPGTPKEHYSKKQRGGEFSISYSSIYMPSCLVLQKMETGYLIMATLGDSIYKDSIYKSNDTKYS